MHDSVDCLIDFMPLYKRLNLEDVKDGAQYERLLQFHFPSLLDVQPLDITKTLLKNDVITYVFLLTVSLH